MTLSVYQFLSIIGTLVAATGAFLWVKYQTIQNKKHINGLGERLTKETGVMNQRVENRVEQNEFEEVVKRIDENYDELRFDMKDNKRFLKYLYQREKNREE